MIVLLWLLKRKNLEIKIILFTLFILMSLPIISIVLVASSGVSAVGNALAALNPQTHQVEIYTPTGNIASVLDVTTNWPTRGFVSDEFGTRDTERKELGLGTHTGIDIANQTNVPGEPVTVFMDGVVVTADTTGETTCGLYVRVQHIHNIQSLYCHLSAIHTHVLAKVVPGDVIGLMGTTGASTGVHTHFQINVNGIPVNPRTFVSGEPQRSIVSRSFIPNL
jgi:murein DD-endopeptidase MepM/ murein hydrolase activator NlpD